MAGPDFKAKAKMKSKSQITMLMIVGLVLFIIVTFVLYLSKSAVKKQSQQSIKKTQETGIDISPIKEYIAKCLDKLSKDAVILLGKQGGYIYASQGGTLQDFADTDEGTFYVDYNNLKVAYNIMPQKTPTPQHPWATFPYASSTSNSEEYQGYFGEDKMPPLERTSGPHSIQSQIESFIDNNMQNCFDFSSFKSQGYEITMEKSKTSVSIGSSDITIKAKIPTKVINSQTKETFELIDFSTKVNLRLRDMIFSVKEIIDNDVSNIRFNISDSQSPGLKSNLIKNIFFNSGKKIRADLVIITDEKSLIYGIPFQYIFARRNRDPGILFIRPSVFEFPDGYLINDTELLMGKPIKANDPDEDEVQFEIYIGEFGNTKANFPKRLDANEIKFRIEASDGMLSDYQILTVNRAS